MLVLPFVFFAQTAFAELDGYNDDTWADIGDEFSISKGDVSQKRSYSDINDSEGLMSLGTFIKLTQDINLREEPGGTKIKPVLKDSVYQVLGVHINPNGRRYYKVQDGEDGEHVDGEDASPASSHGSYSDQEFMGPNSTYECVFLKP